MKKADPIKVSVDVLNTMSPQKSMVIQAAKKLVDQKFNLHSLIVSDVKNESGKDLTQSSEENNFVKVRYVNEETNEAFVIPVRQLLNLDVAESVATLEEFKAKTDDESIKVAKVHENMMEEADEAGEAVLPASFVVVNVAPRTQKVGTKDVEMYPAYYHKNFNAEVARREKEGDFDADNGETAVSSVYQDFSFMSDLTGSPLEARYTGAEPLKTITIGITGTV